jgi:hypothetical protein
MAERNILQRVEAVFTAGCIGKWTSVFVVPEGLVGGPPILGADRRWHDENENCRNNSTQAEWQVIRHFVEGCVRWETRKKLATMIIVPVATKRARMSPLKG